MSLNLLNSSKLIRGKNAVAAGTTSQTSALIDTQGFQSVIGIALLGALSATQVTKLNAQHGDLANGSDLADLAGTSTGPAADADSNKLLALEVHKPVKRYLQFTIVRGTANAVIDGLVVLLTPASKQPVTTLDATVSAQKTVASPAAGTP